MSNSEVNKIIRKAILNYLKCAQNNPGTKEIQNHILAIKRYLGVTISDNQLLRKVCGNLAALAYENCIETVCVVTNKYNISNPASMGCQNLWKIVS